MIHVIMSARTVLRSSHSEWREAAELFRPSSATKKKMPEVKCLRTLSMMQTVCKVV